MEEATKNETSGSCEYLAKCSARETCKRYSESLNLPCYDTEKCKDCPAYVGYVEMGKLKKDLEETLRVLDEVTG